MSIFDRFKRNAVNALQNTASSALRNGASSAAEAMKSAAKGAAAGFTAKRETFTFRVLPESLAELQALPEADLDTPYKTAALTVCALCVYAADRQAGAEMLNWLRGPRPLSGGDISFLNDRFRDGKTYV